jgi:NADP-dependent 3-hydroxy acid dehydrogenase YdfG
MCAIKRTILVTGASSGIGRAIAKKLLQQDHFVIGTSRDCKKFKTKHKNFSFIEIDFSQLDTIKSIIKLLVKQYPLLDVVIFSAGYGKFGSIEQFSYRQIEQLLTVNFTSQALITSSIISSLKEKKHSNLIYIGSEAALKGSRKGSIYCASKFALRGFTQALRDECGTSSVRVSLINPGMVKTSFFDELNFQPGDEESQALLPEDIAETVNYILNSSRHSDIDEINLNPANKVIKFK